MVSNSESSHNRLSAAPDSAHDAPRTVGLSRDEEQELAARIAAGDREARNRMVQANLGLVVKIGASTRDTACRLMTLSVRGISG